MKKYFFYLLYGFVSLSYSLSGQGVDVVGTLHYSGSINVTNFEPLENGSRTTSSWSYNLGYELRTKKNFGWLLSYNEETLTSYKSPETADEVPAPFSMVHPYHSSISASYLALGVQYNLRIGSGDLSFGVLAGPGLAVYSRTWDVVNARFFNDKIDFDRLSFASYVDMSSSTWRLSGNARLQYTYWISRDLAFSVGAEYNQSNYLGGGVDTVNGLRYELNQREFFPGEVNTFTTPLLYNVNYDNSTLAPDPSIIIRQLRFTIGFTGKLNAL